MSVHSRGECPAALAAQKRAELVARLPAVPRGEEDTKTHLVEDTTETVRGPARSPRGPGQSSSVGARARTRTLRASRAWGGAGGGAGGSRRGGVLSAAAGLRTKQEPGDKRIFFALLVCQVCPDPPRPPCPAPRPGGGRASLTPY